MNTEQHIKKISNIQDEVKELHPLLQTLLPKIPNITHCEYTHGSQEKGADFVLCKTDTIPIKKYSYIGFIAKTGKIHQNLSDIETQIEECFLFKRLVENGQKKIQITEVWVIVSGNITNNAKEKISAKFKVHNITFLSAQELGMLVEKHLPHYWESVEPEVLEYLTHTIQKNREEDKRLALLDHCAEDFFIEPTITEICTNQWKANKPRVINILEAVDKNPFIIIEGGMGAGKSTFVRHLVIHLATPDIFELEKKLPILLSFKDFLDKYQADVKKVIAEEIPNTIPADVRQNTSVVIIIDAADEVNLPESELYQKLKELESQSNEQIKIILTTRNIQNLIPEKQKDIGLICRINPLSTKQIISILQVQCKNLSTQTRLFEDLKKSSLFKNIPRNPITAILLANIINQCPQELPSNLTELYSKYMEIVVGRWDEKKGLATSTEYEAAHRILRQTAVYMLDNGLQEIAISELLDRIQKYLKDRNLNLQADKLLTKFQTRCEIVTFNNQRRTFSFKHKSFAEFLYAEEKIDTASFQIKNILFHPFWQGTAFFYFGLKKDCSGEMSQILDVTPKDIKEKLIKVWFTADYLLAGYMTPTRYIHEVLKQIIFLAATIYLDTVNLKTKTPLLSFSQLDLLAFMRCIMRQCYAYNFFTNVLEGIALEIPVENSWTEEQQIVSLFLIGSILLAMKKDGFCILLEKFGNRIPNDIKMALMAEYKEAQEINKIFKKQEKMIHKRWGKDITRNQVDRLFKTPLLSYYQSKVK